jgi:hypothetical protein
MWFLRDPPFFFAVVSYLLLSCKCRAAASSNDKNSIGSMKSAAAQPYPGDSTTTSSNSPTKELHKYGIFHHYRKKLQLWTVPFLVCGGSVIAFPRMAGNFRRIAQWASDNKWIPTTEEQVNLQTNVVTQVVNGPVITSVSILFATLASMTISSLYERQLRIREAYTMEVHSLRQLRMWIPAYIPKANNNRGRLSQVGEELLVQYTKQLSLEIGQQRAQEPTLSLKVVDGGGDMYLMALLAWCQELFVLPASKSAGTVVSMEIVGRIHDRIESMLEQRHLRWLALNTTFPLAHWATLTFLAFCIAISFLVATDQQDFIFLEGLQVRIFWAGKSFWSFTKRRAAQGLPIILYCCCSPHGVFHEFGW